MRSAERGKKVTVFDNFTYKKSPRKVIETGSALPDAPILTSPKLPNNRCGQTYSEEFASAVVARARVS
jgi:hypothetical protein